MKPTDLKVTVQRCDVSHLLGQPRPLPTGTPGPGVTYARPPPTSAPSSGEVSPEYRGPVYMTALPLTSLAPCFVAGLVLGIAIGLGVHP